MHALVNHSSSKIGAMYDNQFSRNERRIRTRAKLYTGLLFGSLLAATVYFGNGGSFDFNAPTNETVTATPKVQHEMNAKPAKAVKKSKKKRKHRGA